MKRPVCSINVYVSVYRVCRSLKSETNDEINASGTRFVRPSIFLQFNNASFIFVHSEKYRRVASATSDTHVTSETEMRKIESNQIDEFLY